MSAKWKQNSNPEVILSKLDSIRSLSAQNVSFIGISYHEYIAFLKSIVEIDDGFSSETCGRLIKKGINSAAREETFNARSVISSINKEIRDYLNSADKNYSLVTTCNISVACYLNNLHVNSCYLHFHKILPTKYRKARNSAINEVSSWLIDQDEPFSYYLVAHTLAKDEFEAVFKLLDAIDLIRGIWNLRNNKSIAFNFVGRKNPINQITLGALHTIHYKDGSEASKTSWYEPDYIKNSKKFDFSTDSYATLKLANSYNKCITRLARRDASQPKQTRTRYGKSISAYN